VSIHYYALYSDLLEDLEAAVPNLNLRTVNDLKQLEPWPDITLQQFRALKLAQSFFKKLEDGADSKKTNGAALETFLASNLRCKEWRLTPNVWTESDYQLLNSFKNAIHKFWYTTGVDTLLPGFNEILDFANTGPGASLGAYGNDFYTKMFAGPMTCTRSSLYLVYEHYIKSLPNWDHAERQRYTEFGEPDVVVGNRLSFVPKNQDTSRVICTEPSLNMFFQLGVGALIEKRLSQFFGIRLASQPDYNRYLARIGSIDQSFSTIDLSCASDSVSLSMLKAFLPEAFYEQLLRFRSPNVTLPDGSVEELHMVSSMGNGFTFPLQTLLFSCVVSAVYDLLGISMRRNRHPKSVKSKALKGRSLAGLSNFEIDQGQPGNFGVFGDDIIVEAEAYNQTVRLLHLLGFRINAEKSFHEGWFRESCGGDYESGNPTRGVYIKSLETAANRYVAINRLNHWSAEMEIPLPRTVQRLLKSVRFLPVPLAENDDAGVKVPLDYITVKDSRKEGYPHYDHNRSIVYKVWSSAPTVIRFKDGEILVPKGAKKRIYSAPGLIESFLRGDIEGGTMTIRFGKVRYTPKVSVTPSWNYVKTATECGYFNVSYSVGQAQLATAIRRNFFA
jgi:hypothetical protein